MKSNIQNNQEALARIESSSEFYADDELNFIIELSMPEDTGFVTTATALIPEELKKAITDFKDSQNYQLLIPLQIRDNHFVGIHIVRTLGGFIANYFDPTGMAPQHDNWQITNEAIDSALDNKASWNFNQTKLQHVTYNEDTFEISNNHCGAFVAEILIKLARKDIRIFNGKLQAIALQSRPDSFVDIVDYAEEKSNEYGKQIRQDHLELVGKDKSFNKSEPPELEEFVNLSLEDSKPYIPQPSVIERDIDDSSDDETIQKSLQKTVEQQWRNFKGDEKDFIENLKSQDLTEDQIKQSFLLHHAGVRAIYEGRVAGLYYQKKEEKFAKIDESSQREKIEEVIKNLSKKIIKDLCRSIFHILPKNEKIKEIEENILGNLESEIRKITDIIIQKRILGRRIEMVEELLNKKDIEEFGSKIIKQLFEMLSLELREPRGIEISYQNHNLLTKAANCASSELSKIEFNGTALLENNKSPKKWLRDRTLDFSGAEFERTVTKAWKVVIPKRAGSCVDSKTFETQEILNAYLQDLVEIDKKSKGGLNSKAWELALCYDEVMNLLEINQQRVASIFVFQFGLLIKQHLKKSLEKDKTERPTLPESFEFVSKNPEEFLANLRLSNRSQTRTVRNFQDLEKKPDGEIFHRQWRFGENSKPALERQEVNTSLSRVDMIDNLGNYKDVYNRIRDLKDKHKVDDRQLAIWFRKILSGQKIENLQTEIFDNIDKKNLVNIIYLMFGVESARNPASFIASFMILDLIEAKKMDWQEAFCSSEHLTRYGGGYLPMSIGKMPKQATNKTDDSLITPEKTPEKDIAKIDDQFITPKKVLTAENLAKMSSSPVQASDTSSIGTISTRGKKTKQQKLDEYRDQLNSEKEQDKTAENIESLFNEEGKPNYKKETLPDFIDLLVEGEIRYFAIDKGKSKVDLDKILKDLRIINRSTMVKGAPVESARRVNRAYKRFMSHPYKYEGGEQSDAKVGIEKTAELVKREAEIAAKWYKEIGQNFKKEGSLSEVIEIAKNNWYQERRAKPTLSPIKTTASSTDNLQIDHR